MKREHLQRLLEEQKQEFETAVNRLLDLIESLGEQNAEVIRLTKVIKCLEEELESEEQDYCCCSRDCL